MIQILMFFVLTLVLGCSSAPQPPQVCLTEDVNPVNFFNTPHNRHTVITAEMPQKGWIQQFTYSVNTQDHSPAFFYAIAHADQIIAYIKPRSSNFIVSKLRSEFRKYGVVTPLKVLVADYHQKPQVILKCIKFTKKN